MSCAVSCIRAVRYAGDDPKILKRFRELRSEASCDVLVNPPSDLVTPGRLTRPTSDRRTPGFG